MDLMADWVFHAVEITTGNVIMDLPLVGFTGTVGLVAGNMSASLPLLHLEDVETRRQILDCTTPGRFSIAALRDGILVGEWIIWQRTRKNDLAPIGLTGAELISFAQHRVVPYWSWSQTEQLEIARAMLATAFGPSGAAGGAVAVAVPSAVRSEQLRDRTYKLADGDIGTRLKELSETENGFDYWIEPAFAITGTIRVIRTVRYGFPRAGTEQPLVFEMTSSGGSIISIGLEEDGSRLASKVWTVGQSSTDSTLMGTYEDGALVEAGFPGMERTATYSTVTLQSTIDAYARTEWLDAQRMQEPQDMVVLADGYPAVGEYALGDRVGVHLEPSINYPQGYDRRVRILGWTFKPPSDGPETIALSIAREDQ